MGAIEYLKRWAGRLKIEVHALYLAYKDPRTPWHARILAVCVVGYAVSPIDLIPDFIPILGYLDDLILVPLGIALAVRMIPEEVLDESREEARMEEPQPAGRAAAAVVVCVWVLLFALCVWLALRWAI